MSDQSKLMDGRIALVTGASRGIGRACALELSRQGARVIALARTQGALEDLDDEIVSLTGQDATLVPLDLTKYKDIEKLGVSIYERFGVLDAAFLGAGTLGILTPAHHLELKDQERVMRLNFSANTRLIRSLDPLLRASKAGRVVVPSGLSTGQGQAFYGGYAASKSAIEAFVRSYAAENDSGSLSANIVRLPAVKTALLDTAFPGGYPHKALLPEDVAPFIVRSLSAQCQDNGASLVYGE